MKSPAKVTSSRKGNLTRRAAAPQVGMCRSRGNGQLYRQAYLKATLRGEQPPLFHRDSLIPDENTSAIIKLSGIKESELLATADTRGMPLAILQLCTGLTHFLSKLVHKDAKLLDRVESIRAIATLGATCAEIIEGFRKEYPDDVRKVASTMQSWGVLYKPSHGFGGRKCLNEQLNKVIDSINLGASLPSPFPCTDPFWSEQIGRMYEALQKARELERKRASTGLPWAEKAASLEAINRGAPKKEVDKWFDVAWEALNWAYDQNVDQIPEYKALGEARNKSKDGKFETLIKSEVRKKWRKEFDRPSADAAVDQSRML